VWAIRADAVTLTLRRDPAGWRGFVRVRTAAPLAGPPLPFLRALPGQQGAAITIGAPVAALAPVHTGFDSVASVADLQLPAGSDGQLLGADEVGRQLLLPLVPATDGIIAARVDLIYAQQLVARAEATGARVTIITDSPARWSPMISARVSVVGEDAELPTGPEELHVYDDRIPPPPDAAAATLSLTAPGGPAPHGRVVLDQAGDYITVTAGGQSWQVIRRVDPAEFTFLPAAHQRGLVLR
jgi:hypothetical protein